MDFEDHIKYLEKIALERCFIGGGFANQNGEMIVFQAEDLEEANKIAMEDPLIKRNFYTCNLFEWDLAIVNLAGL